MGGGYSGKNKKPGLLGDIYIPPEAAVDDVRQPLLRPHLEPRVQGASYRDALQAQGLLFSCITKCVRLVLLSGHYKIKIKS